MQRPLVSVVTPVFNEAELVPELHRRLSAALSKLGAYELIFVNDGSRDGSGEALDRLARSDEKAKVLHFSRNFGHQVAITAGIDHAEGDAVVVIDSDLQDPPELIPDMVRLWREGYEVVYAQREERRGETWFKLRSAELFYKLLKRLAHIEIPRNVGDFRLMDRKVVLALRALPERNRFMRGLVSWVGFRQTSLRYARDARKSGATKYPFFKMLRFALDGLTSFSHAPLKLATVLGLLIAAGSAVLILWAVLARVFTSRTMPGWTSLMVVVLFLGGVQLLTLGILGEYIARIFDEVKGRPLYLVARRSGFEAAEPAPGPTRTARA